MKNEKKYLAIPKSKRKIVKPDAQIYITVNTKLGTGTSIKSDEVKLVLNYQAQGF
jgi:hypothetical protein